LGIEIIIRINPKNRKIMKLEELALCTCEEFEQELNKMCSYPTDDMNPGEFDAAFEERVRARSGIKWARIEALLDGKLTVDQVVEQEHSEYDDDDLDLDGIHRGILEGALEKLKEGKDRSEIIEETVDALELL
jgi:hypothetical protein